MKTKIGYKICCGFKSCVECILPVKYKLNEFVYPHKRGGPLCLFGTLKDAKRSGFEGQLYKAEYIPSKLDKIWDGMGEYKLKDMLLKFKGTVLASAVKLLEEKK